MLLYNIHLAGGIVSETYKDLCYSFLFFIKNNEINGYNIDDIEKISVHHEYPDTLDDYVDQFDLIMRSSIFSEKWEKDIVFSKKCFKYNIDPKVTGVTEVLTYGPLVRLTWEFPSLVKNIVHWKQKGYTSDISILLGHFLDINLVYQGFVNKSHLLYKPNMSLLHIISDMSNFIKTISKNESGINNSRMLYPEDLFLKSRSIENKEGRSLDQYLERAFSPPFWEYKLTDENFKEIIDNAT
ncbi:MAG: hypothetical protein KDC43_29350 [Saprospiraceae bacterium]|nr:hypothetical protein [Saprospiraceae bacterium]